MTSLTSYLNVTSSSREYILSWLTPQTYKGITESDLSTLTGAVHTLLTALSASGDPWLIESYVRTVATTSRVLSLAMEHIVRHQKEYMLFIADSSKFIALHSRRP